MPESLNAAAKSADLLLTLADAAMLAGCAAGAADVVSAGASGSVMGACASSLELSLRTTIRNTTMIIGPHRASIEETPPVSSGSGAL
jgi:hypothetical protein